MESNAKTRGNSIETQNKAEREFTDRFRKAQY